MVGVAQLVEHLVVVQDVAGSSPVTHPKSQATHNGVAGSTVQPTLHQSEPPDFAPPRLFAGVNHLSAFAVQFTYCQSPTAGHVSVNWRPIAAV